jgi:5'(3')-deoxyribonucleotidase
MRIGLDFDGTIADITWAKIRYARDAFGVELLPEQTARATGIPVLGAERYEQLVDAVHGSDLSLQMPPMPGALEAIERLASTHELYIVTARTDPEAELARAWIEECGMYVDGFVHTVRGSKAAACLDLNVAVHLDDNPGVLADLGETLPALIDAPYNRAQPRDSRVQVVEHWHAFEALVESLAVAPGR